MNGQKHIINRQVLEVTLPSRDNALVIQNNVNEIVKTRLAASLDELFSVLIGKDEVLRIDKLEIDLGRIHADKLNDELVSKTVEKIEDQLIKLIHELKDGSYQATSNRDANDSKAKSRLISSHNSCLDQLIYFLENGFLPWWNQSKEDFSLTELLEKSLVVGQANIADQIGPLLENEKVRKRLISQFDHELVIRLLKTINSDYVFHLKKLFQILKAIQNANTSSLVSEKQLEEIYWDLAISRIVGKVPVYSEAQEIEFLQRLFDGIIKTQSKKSRLRSLVNLYQAITSLSKEIEPPVYKHLLLAVKSLASKDQLNPEQFRIVDLGKDGIELFNQPDNKSQPGEEDILSINQDIRHDDIQIPESNEGSLFEAHESKEKDIIKSTESSGVDLTINYSDNKGKKQPSESHSKKHDTLSKKDTPAGLDKFASEDGDSLISDYFARPKSFSADRSSYFDNKELDDILVHNAGLVLLHPFLKYFFTGLNLLKEDQFINREAAHHAVHLLQYLVTKELKYAEYELVLNKILCGLNVSDPIPSEIEISDWELEECDNLLKAVLEQWNALKTRSTEALRETFLKREGILSCSSGCTLKVERNTFDVLLDRLPWGLSLIKLPWNPQIIYVEW